MFEVRIYIRLALSHLAHANNVDIRLRGVGDDASVGFQAISGLHYLIANQERVLVSSLPLIIDLFSYSILVERVDPLPIR